MPIKTPPLTRRAALGVLGASLVLPSAGLASGVVQIRGQAFGTRWKLTTPAPADQPTLGEAISALFAQIDQVFSPWRPDSVISRFNGQADRTRHREFAHVTAAALEVARASDGAFDPTVGPLVGRWGFGPIQGGGAPDWRALSCHGSNVWKERPDMTLDLCGIVKGWALDRAAAAVDRLGLDDFLIELGGEFVARGRHPERRAWRIAVDAPVSATDVPPILQLPSGKALATSGVWAQSYQRGERLYSHIIDPESGTPIEGTLRSVTVVADAGIAADGWATALCAAGAGPGPALAERHGLSALFLVEREGTLHEIQTGRIASFLA